jgi:hypothetical protein
MIRYLFTRTQLGFHPVAAVIYPRPGRMVYLINAQQYACTVNQSDNCKVALATRGIMHFTQENAVDLHGVISVPLTLGMTIGGTQILAKYESVS